MTHRQAVTSLYLWLCCADTNVLW